MYERICAETSWLDKNEIAYLFIPWDSFPECYMAKMMPELRIPGVNRKSKKQIMSTKD
jgi:hypothetical protein